MNKPTSLQHSERMKKSWQNRQATDLVRKLAGDKFRKFNAEHKGEKHPMFGRKHTPEALAKMRLNAKSQNGELAWNWKGGLLKNRNKTLEDIAGRPKPSICEICSGAGKINFDHDHVTGEFRGWICRDCNLTLGFARDRTELLQKLIDYLNNSKRVKLTEYQRFVLFGDEESHKVKTQLANVTK